MSVKKYTKPGLLSAAVAGCLSASTSLWAADQSDYLGIDCFRREPSITDININRAICDAQATNPASVAHKIYKHGVYRPVNDHDYNDYPKLKEDNKKCAPNSQMYICLGVGSR